MRLLDGCSGAGGIAVGYAKFFDVTGVDIERHPDYPFRQITADIRDVLSDKETMSGFDAAHVSPPCPRWSTATPRSERAKHPDIIGEVRELLVEWGGPWVIENVPRAPLRHPAVLCGQAFGLGALCRDGRWRGLRRHRKFEASFPLKGSGCGCGPGREVIGVYGDGGPGKRSRKAQGGGYKGTMDEMKAAMGIDWIKSRDDLTDSIPPAYGRYVGLRLAKQVFEVSVSA
jgi:DNA (cytosine-5)-methyltransferase 1